MKTIAVFFGGKSTEHDVSIVTAISSIIKPLELSKKYRVEAIYIAKNGAWYWGDQYKNISHYSSGRINELIKRDKTVQVDFDGGLTLKKTSLLTKDKKVKIDVAFPATHGTYGEDGSLMGLLRMAGIPFVGCDMEASVIAMNKLLAHQVVSATGIKSHNYLGITKVNYEDKGDDFISRCNKMSYPLFVKPVHLGSSIGITKVDEPNELLGALDTAFYYDDAVIVEEAVKNLIEVTLPIIGPAKDPLPGLVEQPIFDEDKIFDFSAKYIGQGGKKGKPSGKTSGAQGYSNLPAKIDEDLYKRVVDLGCDVYKIVGCSGIARIDMLIDSKTEEVYFNEVNPLTGSLYMHNWKAAGISPVELLTKLVSYAESDHQTKGIVETTFDTNFLKQF